jgi:hypothetical protein
MKAIAILGAVATVRGDPEVCVNTNSATCINDSIKNLNNLQTAGNYCDAGIRDVTHFDKDVCNESTKNVNCAKYTNIQKNNAKVGPNICRKSNDVVKDCSVMANICRALDDTTAVKVPYPYRHYNNVNGVSCNGPYAANNCYGGNLYNGGWGGCSSPYYGGYGGCSPYYGGYGGCGDYYGGGCYGGYGGGCYGGYGGCGGGYYGGDCYGGYGNCGYNNYGNNYYNGGAKNCYSCQSGTY